MPINNKQKGLLHIYADAAHLERHEYESLLVQYSGCRSCTDDYFEQQHFDVIMPALEVRIQERIDRGEIARRDLPRRIGDLMYWRRRAEKPGMVNRRQFDLLSRLWSSLQDHIGPKPDTYLLAIANRACPGKTTALHRLSSNQANCLIEALKDRLKHAIRKTNEETAA